jgi:hypothetical protein
MAARAALNESDLNPPLFEQAKIRREWLCEAMLAGSGAFPHRNAVLNEKWCSATKTLTLSFLRLYSGYRIRLCSAQFCNLLKRELING